VSGRSGHDRRAGRWHAIQVTRSDAGGQLWNVGRIVENRDHEHPGCVPSYDRAAVQRRAEELNAAHRWPEVDRRQGDERRAAVPRYFGSDATHHERTKTK